MLLLLLVGTLVACTETPEPEEATPTPIETPTPEPTPQAPPPPPEETPEPLFEPTADWEIALAEYLAQFLPMFYNIRYEET